jgi:hypothetical protein
MWIFILLLLPPLTVQQAQRLPLQKNKIEIKSPTNYQKRLVRVDPATGEEIYYDPKPRVVLVDAKSGRYALKWIGYDGKEKTIIYQRPDAIDAVVSASVSKTPSGKYRYIYAIQNLPVSGQHLSEFVVQTFTSDVSPVKVENIHNGQMTNTVKEFQDGNWISFGILSNFRPMITPGRSIEFGVVSSAPPGLVECRVTGGEVGMKGVGEGPPPELMDVLPGYEAWPHGYTIGPVENLKALSSGKRAEYIRQRLAQFKKLGWMTADVVPWYEQALKGGDLEKIYHRAEQDPGKLTTEVMGMIRYTLRRE